MELFNIIVVVVYIIIIAAIAVYSRNKSRTADEFILAGRNVGGWMSAFAYGTTYFSAVIFIGYAGKFGFNYGLAAVWVGIGNAVIGSYLAWKVLAKRTRHITNYLNVNTMPGFFEKRYLNKNVKLLSAIIIFVFLLPYSASVYQGLSELFKAVFDIEFFWCVIIMAAFTALYVFFGGYAGTALSNFFQGIVMLIGVIVMVIILMTNPKTGFSGLAQLAENGLGLFPAANGKGLLNEDWFNLIIVVFLTSFGVWALPQVIHKFYAVKDNSAIKRAVIICTVFALVVGAGAYFSGSLARLFMDELPNGNVDMVMPEVLSQALPVGFLGLIMVLLLSASMSTLSSLAISGASAVSVDIYKGYINKEAKDKNVNIMLKIVSLIFIALSAVIAIFKVDAIVTMMSLSWGTLAGCFMGPYIYGIYSKKISNAAVFTSLIGGVVITVVLVLVFGSTFPDPKYSGFAAVLKGGIGRSPLIGVIAMAFSMIVTPLVSRFTKKPDEQEVEKMFENIKKSA